MSGDILAIVENLGPAAEILLKHYHVRHSWWQSFSCLCSLRTSLDDHGIPHQLRFFSQTIYRITICLHISFSIRQSPSIASFARLGDIARTNIRNGRKNVTNNLFPITTGDCHQSTLFDLSRDNIRQNLFFSSFWSMSTPSSAQCKEWWFRHFYSEYIPRAVSSLKSPTYLFTQTTARSQIYRTNLGEFQSVHNQL